MLGKSEDELEAMRHLLELVPKELLALDALVAANLEWLAALSAKRALVETWWLTHQAFAGARFDAPIEALPFFEARDAPPNTQAIAALPAATLGASLEAVSESNRALAAQLALLEALAFAPKLVVRDLVLALTIMSQCGAST
jgi:hypothetical protein